MMQGNQGDIISYYRDTSTTTAIKFILLLYLALADAYLNSKLFLKTSLGIRSNYWARYAFCRRAPFPSSTSRIRPTSSLHTVLVDVQEETTKTSYKGFGTISNRITVIDSEPKARAVLDVLSDPSISWACDTEVDGIDLKVEGPVGHGRVICVSIYGGPRVDFGLGEGPGSALWIENAGDNDGLLNIFKDWFESHSYKKVWHNYGFDRHVIHNMGIDCQGFLGDTMHMARLWDTSRDRATGGGDGYSLESLCETLIPNDPAVQKISMKELFGKGKLKRDGTESKVKQLPNILELQTGEDRERWIEYSAKDAMATWGVFEQLKKELKQMVWQVVDTKKPSGYRILGNMYDFYQRYLKDFGELLTDMERNGIKIDKEGHLVQAEKLAREHREELQKKFYNWLRKHRPHIADRINLASSAQMQQLFFGAIKDNKKELTKIFKLDKETEELAIEREQALNKNPYAGKTLVELKTLLKEKKLKLSGTKAQLVERLLTYESQQLGLNDLVKYDKMTLYQLRSHCEMSNIDTDGTEEELRTRLKEDAKYSLELEIRSNDANVKNSEIQLPKSQIEIEIKTFGLTPVEYTPKGQPQVSSAVLRKLAGSNLYGEDGEPKWGDAYEHFGGGEEGAEACQAIGALADIGQIDATITNFLEPLQRLVDENSRIHCSLNLNTETGRLSSRRPNLQNQPALEKDKYRIRSAFVASEGNTLIVADYGQLELRILAHITNCKSMIEAFKSGGCFHSRTAMGMYPYIKQAVDDGQVLLEWDYSKGQPNVPLVKDKFGSERRKAKTLNFSIAYGKTVHGLAQDWAISKKEAENTLEAWYADRPEVKWWQQMTQDGARKEGLVRTILGRNRRLPDAKGSDRNRKVSKAAEGHAMRAAINTPIQGSAADIVMMAMIKLWRSKTLKDLGWTLLLQIHDEVILEGPVESRDAAMREVRQCMEYPFDDVLSEMSIHLDVDAKSANSWYEAK